MDGTFLGQKEPTDWCVVLYLFYTLIESTAVSHVSDSPTIVVWNCWSVRQNSNACVDPSLNGHWVWQTQIVANLPNKCWAFFPSPYIRIFSILLNFPLVVLHSDNHLLFSLFFELALFAHILYFKIYNLLYFCCIFNV